MDGGTHEVPQGARARHPVRSRRLAVARSDHGVDARPTAGDGELPDPRADEEQEHPHDVEPSGLEAPPEVRGGELVLVEGSGAWGFHRRWDEGDLAVACGVA